jgi:tetratricopeptide (TPR) repeat protein
MDEHLTREELERVMGLDGTWPELAEWLFHLLACEACQEALCVASPERGPAFLREAFGQEAPLAAARGAGLSSSALRSSLERARGMIEQAAFEQAAAERLWKQVSKLAPAQRALLIRNAPRFHSVGFATLLLEESRGCWSSDPAAAMALVDIALELCHKLVKTSSNPRNLNDIIARTFAYRANVHQICSEFQEAGQAFLRARRYLEQGTGDPLERATVDSLEASLRVALGSFPQALGLIHRAQSAYLQISDSRSEARLLIQEAFVLREMGETPKAVAVLDHLWSRFTPEEIGPRQLLYAGHNLSVYLVDLGCLWQARSRLPQLRRLAAEINEPLQSIRVDWLEAMIDERLGHHSAAEAGYLQVRSFFVEMGIGYDAALVSLDLAGLYLDQGRYPEVREIAAQMVPIFLACDVHREAVTALSVFKQAVEREEANRSLLEQLSGYLKSTRRRPLPASPAS